MKELKEALKSDDLNKIKEKTEELNKAAQSIGQEMYKKAAEAQAKTQKSDKKDEGKKDEKVVEAEVVDEKAGKKA